MYIAASLCCPPANTVSTQTDDHDVFSYSYVILLAKLAVAKVHGRKSLKVTSHM